MPCLPATQFCCGFTVTCGVKTILLLNLMFNVFILAITSAHMIFGFPNLRLSGSYMVEMLSMMLALAGVPIIIMAFHGILHRNEVMIRMYLYYMWMVFAICLSIVLWEFVFTDACYEMNSSTYQKEGQAWACGMARYISIFVTLMTMSIFGYFSHVVYSHCEDLAELGGGPELADLVHNKEAYLKRHHKHNQNVYSSIESMANHKQQGWLWETAVGAAGHEGAVSEGLGGGQTIFGGTFHEMSYPPSRGLEKDHRADALNDKL